MMALNRSEFRNMIMPGLNALSAGGGKPSPEVVVIYSPPPDPYTTDNEDFIDWLMGEQEKVE